jgi:hypothetical protein
MTKVPRLAAKREERSALMRSVTTRARLPVLHLLARLPAATKLRALGEQPGTSCSMMARVRLRERLAVGRSGMAPARLEARSAMVRWMVARACLGEMPAAMRWMMVRAQLLASRWVKARARLGMRLLVGPALRMVAKVMPWVRSVRLDVPPLQAAQTTGWLALPWARRSVATRALRTT